MRTARAKISVDIMLVTAPMTIAGKALRPGDIIVSDGVSTWGELHEEAIRRLEPLSKSGQTIMEQAVVLYEARPKFDAKEIAT